MICSLEGSAIERVQELKNIKDWKETLENSTQKPVVLLKHSTRCPISAGAYEEFSKHVAKEANPDVDYHLVLVVEDRPVSNAVAEDLGVKHESPQILLIKNKEVVWHTSHRSITAESLREHIR